MSTTSGDDVHGSSGSVESRDSVEELSTQEIKCQV